MSDICCECRRPVVPGEDSSEIDCTVTGAIIGYCCDECFDKPGPVQGLPVCGRPNCCALGTDDSQRTWPAGSLA